MHVCTAEHMKPSQQKWMNVYVCITLTGSHAQCHHVMSIHTCIHAHDNASCIIYDIVNLSMHCHCHCVLLLLVLLLAAVPACAECLLLCCWWWWCGGWSNVGLSGGGQERVVLCLQGGRVQQGLVGGECFRLLLCVTGHGVYTT